MIIKPDHEYLYYEGRIDFSDYQAPVFVYPNSLVAVNFTGRTIKVQIENNNSYFDNYLGYILDGVQNKIHLPGQKEKVWITIGEGMEDTDHKLTIFKRMDGCHEYTLYGFDLPEGGRILKPSPVFRKCMEFYGDSVTAGEVSEAVDYTGQPDPEHNGEYSNAYFSYAAIAARMLKARIHNISQGGAALMDGTGWFREPDAIGMESIYDKQRYNLELGEMKTWNFRKYRPQVVVIAIGQNDSHPTDFMKEDPGGEQAARWRRHYRKFVEEIRGRYPRALIILTTTIMEHSPAWDRAVGRICRELEDPKIVHFLYQMNGRGTPGHIRLPEAEQMAIELTSFIKGFGSEIWD